MDGDAHRDDAGWVCGLGKEVMFVVVDMLLCCVMGLVAVRYSLRS